MHQTLILGFFFFFFFFPHSSLCCNILAGQHSEHGGAACGRAVLLLGHGWAHSRQPSPSHQGSCPWVKVPSSCFGWISAAHDAVSLFSSGGEAGCGSAPACTEQSMSWAACIFMLTSVLHHMSVQKWCFSFSAETKHGFRYTQVHTSQEKYPAATESA